MGNSDKLYHSTIAIWLLAVMALLEGCAEPIGIAGPPLLAEAPLTEESRGADTSAEAREIVGRMRVDRSGLIRVALLLPLSGASAELGESLLSAAELALFDIGSGRLEVIPRDTKGSPEGAVEAVAAAIGAGAELILGPLFSSSVSAAAPIARANGVPMIAFSNDRTVAGDGVYLLGFLPSQQVRRVIAYARGQGIERFAALVPDSAYGRMVLQAFGEAVTHFDGNITAIEFYQQQATALFEPVRRIGNYDQRRQDLLDERESLEALGEDDSLARELLDQLEALETLGEPEFEAVFVPEGGALLRALAPLLPYYEIDPLRIRFLGTGLWDDPGLSLEPALIGSWFAGPPPNAGATLSKRFRDMFDREPPRIASLAYDAIALAAALLENSDHVGYLRETITDANGFAGIDGIFRFLDSGVADRGLAIIEVRKNGFAVLSPAPTTFEIPIN